MVWLPMAGMAAQRQLANGKPAVGHVLKCYADGTSTNIPIATDTTGATQANYAVFNATGDITVSGVPIIPHINQDYKYCIYPTQAAADSNTGAIITIDNCLFDVSQHVVDDSDFTTINVEGDANFGDNITVTNGVFSGYAREKVIELEIDENDEILLDWEGYAYHNWTNTAEHTIKHLNYPAIAEGYGQTILLTIANADAFTIFYSDDTYTRERPFTDIGQTVGDKIKILVSCCEADLLFHKTVYNIQAVV
jgi:hypothetical protein